MGTVNWRVTAATIYCDAAESEVTLLVYKDGSAKCIDYKKYGEANKKVAKAVKGKGKQPKQHLECNGPECDRVTQFRDKLFARETTGS